MNCNNCENCGGCLCRRRRNPYRRNADKDHRILERKLNEEPSVENYAALVVSARRTGNDPPHPPLARWEAIIEEWYGTWDTVSEAGMSSRADGSNPEEITLEEDRIIISLGYYGKPIESEHALLLANNQHYPEDGYAVNCSGIDGTSKERFETLEAAANYVNDRLPDRHSITISGEGFATDYVRYQLEGFTFGDMEDLELESPNVLNTLIHQGNAWYSPEDLYGEDEY